MNANIANNKTTTSLPHSQCCVITLVSWAVLTTDGTAGSELVLMMEAAVVLL